MKYRVVFHIDEISKWTLLLNNVKNLLQAVGVSESEIEVLANSEAVSAYVAEGGGSHLEQMAQLCEQGVRFVACNNAIKSIGIEREQLLQFVSIVPAGVAELIERQADGYAYIKP